MTYIDIVWLPLGPPLLSPVTFDYFCLSRFSGRFRQQDDRGYHLPQCCAADHIHRLIQGKDTHSGRIQGPYSKLPRAFSLHSDSSK